MNLKQARKATGLSQVDLDAKAGLRRGTVNDIECGRNSNPSFSVATAIIGVLHKRGLKGVKADELFNLEAVSR